MSRRPNFASSRYDPMEKPAIRLVLVRHGDTEWSRTGRYQGRSDRTLTAEGRAQALDVALRLKDAGISSMLTSPLRRARETADLIAERLGLGAPGVDPRLTEIDYGTWEGLTQAEVRLRWPDELRRWKRTADPDSAAAPGGESLGQVRERLRLFLLDPMWAAHGAGDVLIVSHTGPIRVALLQAARQPLSMFRRIPVPAASIHHLSLQWEERVIGLREK
jgi:probable phosphoglycerate mutase